MKKLLFVGVLLFLSACVQPDFQSYSGNKHVIGQGGIVVESVDGVDFYNTGLPDGATCKLLGKVNYNDGFQIHNRMSKAIKKAGGNTGSMSVVSLKSNFENTDSDSMQDKLYGWKNGLSYSYVVYNCL